MEFFPGSHKLKRLTFMGNGKFKACCPAHEDRNPSLYIAKGDKAWMFKCWSGCSIQAICEAMDIKISDLWFDNSKGISWEIGFFKANLPSRCLGL